MINFFYTDEYLKHDTGQHPESIERIKTVKSVEVVQNLCLAFLALIPRFFGYA